MRQRGFTLIEALVALGIAATALVVLLGRLGASADVQRTLADQRLALDVAANLLADEMLKPAPDGRETHGVVEAAGARLEWRRWTEKTFLDGFVRVNVAVHAPGEPDVVLFLYRDARGGGAG